ncbi:hypothetical protein TWF281_002731 [Arthrobotrys megalospora]
MPPPILHHLRLPLTPYSRASKLQSILFNLHLLYKSSLTTPNPIPQPPPYLITASFNPIYTFGRREVSKNPPESVLDLLSHDEAEIAYTPRGGQVTFHGPGQIVAYPIIDLKRHDLSPKCYIRVLENAIIRVLENWDIKGFTTDEAGVWVRRDRKVASVGVNLRRWVSSHGVALNVDVDLEWFKRIVACGLDGVEMWSMKKEWRYQLKDREDRGLPDEKAVFATKIIQFRGKVLKEAVVDSIVMHIKDGIGCQETKEITVEEVEELGEKYGLTDKGDGVEVLRGSDFYHLRSWGRAGLIHKAKGNLEKALESQEEHRLIPDHIRDPDERAITDEDCWELKEDDSPTFSGNLQLSKKTKAASKTKEN